MPGGTHPAIRDLTLDTARWQCGLDNLLESGNEFSNTDDGEFVHLIRIAKRDFRSKMVAKQEFGTGGNWVIHRSMQGVVEVGFLIEY